MSDDYQVWLERHNGRIEEAKVLIRKYGFKAIIIQEERKPSFLRIKFGRTKIDFRIKMVKTKFVRSIWLCKKDRFEKDDFYLLYASKENTFFIASGSDINREHELRDSEYEKGIKYVVTPFTVFRPAKSFFKVMKARYEGELQKRLSDWI